MIYFLYGKNLITYSIPLGYFFPQHKMSEHKMSGAKRIFETAEEELQQVKREKTLAILCLRIDYLLVTPLCVLRLQTRNEYHNLFVLNVVLLNLWLFFWLFTGCALGARGRNFLNVCLSGGIHGRAGFSGAKLFSSFRRCLAIPP